MAQLLLTVVSGGSVGQNSSQTFTEQGGNFGRSEACDWTLVDTNRFISNVHGQIQFQNNSFVLVDVSTNGIFINSTNNPVGKNNSYTLALNDIILIGQYQVKVTEIDLSTSSVASAPTASPSQGGDSLLGLVMGGEAAAPSTPSKNADPLSMINQQTPSAEPAPSSILDQVGASSSPAPTFEPAPAPAPAPATEQIDPFAASNAQPSAAAIPQSELPDAFKAASQERQPVANNNNAAIPDDWELSGIMPAVKEFDLESLKRNQQDLEQAQAQSADVTPQTESDFKLNEDVAKPPASLEIEFDLSPTIEPETEPVSEPQAETPEFMQAAPVARAEVALAPEPISQPVVEKKPVVDPQSWGETSAPVADTVEPKQVSTQSVNDGFFDTLFEKLELPREFKDSVDKEAFATDIAAILTSTTQGLMSLLNGRSIFKQESRLAVTSVQPRSNNPLKFSIDPTDCLEALLLKKKSGYLSAKDSYDEAVNDLQYHQMAFLAGLQSSMTGVLDELDPESIEAHAKQNSRSLLGKVSSSACWLEFTARQNKAKASVEENLNHVLGQYFAEAYQAQIEKIKNDQKG
ncbi:type VI secretion system-associated FHA domain protein TagH [Catenovulum sp. SM1970]|uniref:type VI secretion system-associated FHA domain protein TagH n=1 Tax=Marinifaba aquimaris TaxID=2741323 RepID=UPI001571F93C|nr:type VI secretion system-associated FHA domain protein TagH [Marinifaba aquimaris]NTS75640.1 type VI secretion system-associated FHA domain protein TagH [Marinifaba aquimaris]